MTLRDRLLPRLNRDQFAQRMMRELRSAGSGEQLIYEADDFRIRLKGPEERTFFLHNAYDEYCRAPRGSRGEVIRHYAATMYETSEPIGDLESTLPMLLPRVRERFWHQAQRLIAQIERTPPVDTSDDVMPFSDDLTLELIIDRPKVMQTLNSAGMKILGKTMAELLPHARENLWKRSNEDFLHVAPGLYRSPWQDTHDASRLMLHDLIWQLKVKGRHVAMTPNRSLLLVTGSDDTGALATMGLLAEKVLQEEPRPMTGVAVQLEGSRWIPFLPPGESPAYWPMKRAAMRSMGMIYSEQKSLLDKLHEKDGKDIFVASQSGFGQQDGAIVSWAVWVESVTDALMPHADRIHFGAAGNPLLGWAPWERVVEKLGHLMEATDHYPPRWRVRTFPSAEELQRVELQPMAAQQAVPEAFLILLCGGVMLAAAIPNPKDVTLQWLRLAGIIALTMLGLSTFFWWRHEMIKISLDLTGYVMTGTCVCAQLACTQTRQRAAQRVAAGAACALAIVLSSRLVIESFNAPLPTYLALAGIAALPGIALMDMLLGHAYLTASQMTMAPFRWLNTSLGIAIILRAILSIGVTMLFNARHPIYMLWNVYGLYMLTRWLLGLLIPGIFVWMAHDCIKRRATQSATGILYVAGVLIFIGEIIALYLLRQTGLPF